MEFSVPCQKCNAPGRKIPFRLGNHSIHIPKSFLLYTEINLWLFGRKWDYGSPLQLQNTERKWGIKYYRAAMFTSYVSECPCASSCGVSAVRFISCRSRCVGLRNDFQNSRFSKYVDKSLMIKGFVKHFRIKYKRYKNRTTFRWLHVIIIEFELHDRIDCI